MNIGKWFRISFTKIATSIAFYPAVIAVGFLILSWGMLEIDFSPWGKNLKQGLSWLSLKDASTARSIISTVAGAIISLTVFSFSMVMIVLNQAASQMSNRVLSSMIENRFQQIVLGVYIGTIVYALFLLSTIRDITSGIYVPALSIYLLILLTVIDIFLFIYFLDYVTQTIKYETVITRVQEQTQKTMLHNYEEEEVETMPWADLPSMDLVTEESNYFQGYNKKKLLKIAAHKNIHICFLCKRSAYLIKGTVFIKLYGIAAIDEECKNDILMAIDFFKGQPIDRNADYGFSQLAEVGIKALSPGINDPATAVISLHALTALFAYKLYHNIPQVKKDVEGTPRIFMPASSFEEMFEKCIGPFLNYGKKDAYIQTELVIMLQQLKTADHKNLYTNVFEFFLDKIKRAKILEEG